MFANQSVNLDLLREKAFNLRWATVPKDVIPLTAADPDFPVAEPIREALINYAKDGYFSYGPSEGLSSFRESLSRRYQEKEGSTMILPISLQLTVLPAVFGWSAKLFSAKEMKLSFLIQ